MIRWLQRWVGPKPVEGERLFQPPVDVATRTDSIDEALAREAEHMTLGRKLALGALTGLSASSNLNNSFGLGGPQHHEIVKVWGQDQYVAPSTVKK